MKKAPLGQTARPLVFVTTNANKLHEATTYLKPLGFEVQGIALDLPETQSVDLQSIVKAKAKAAYAVLKQPLLVEDTALCFEAWGALPGPLIKFFEQHLGLTGMVQALVPFNNPKAQAYCGIGYHTGQSVQVFTGCVQGRIVAPRGQQGFGWDAIFEPQNQTSRASAQTFGQMSLEQKQRYSMRGLALAQLKDFLQQQPLTKTQPSLSATSRNKGGHR